MSILLLFIELNFYKLNNKMVQKHEKSKLTDFHLKM